MAEAEEPVVNSNLIYCQRIGPDEYEAEATAYTKEQLRLLSDDPLFLDYLHRQTQARRQHYARRKGPFTTLIKFEMAPFGN